MVIFGHASCCCEAGTADAAGSSGWGKESFYGNNMFEGTVVLRSYIEKEFGRLANGLSVYLFTYNK